MRCEKCEGERERAGWEMEMGESRGEACWDTINGTGGASVTGVTASYKEVVTAPKIKDPKSKSKIQNPMIHSDDVMAMAQTNLP